MPVDGDVERRRLQRQCVPLHSGRFDERPFPRRELLRGRRQVGAGINRKRTAGQACLDRELRDEPGVAASEHQQSISQLDSGHRDRKRLTLCLEDAKELHRVPSSRSSARKVLMI